MRDKRDPRVIFAEFLTQGLNRVQVDDEPPAPPVPRSPHPDSSQGAGPTVYPEDPKQAFARVILEGVSEAQSRPLWQQVIP